MTRTRQEIEPIRDTEIALPSRTGNGTRSHSHRRPKKIICRFTSVSARRAVSDVVSWTDALAQVVSEIGRVPLLRLSGAASKMRN